MDYSGGYVHVNSSCGAVRSTTPAAVAAARSTMAEMRAPKIIAPHMYIHGTCQDRRIGPHARDGGCAANRRPAGRPARTAPGGLSGRPCPRPNRHLRCAYDAVSGWMPRGTRNTVTLTPGVYWGGWNFSGNSMTVRLSPACTSSPAAGSSVAGDSTPSVSGAIRLRRSRSGPDFQHRQHDGPDLRSRRPMPGRRDSTATQASGQGAERCDLGSRSSACPWKGILMWQDGDGSNPRPHRAHGGQGSSPGGHDLRAR